MEQKVNIASRQKNKSFCVLPWIHLATHPIGTVTPCCITDMKDGVSTAAHEDNDNLHFFLSIKTFRMFDWLKGVNLGINKTKKSSRKPLSKIGIEYLKNNYGRILF